MLLIVIGHRIYSLFRISRTKLSIFRSSFKLRKMIIENLNRVVRRNRIRMMI